MEHQLSSKRSTEQVPGGRSGLGQKHHTMQDHMATDMDHCLYHSYLCLFASLSSQLPHSPLFTVATEFIIQYSNNFLSLHCPYNYYNIIYLYIYNIYIYAHILLQNHFSGGSWRNHAQESITSYIALALVHVSSPPTHVSRLHVLRTYHE